MLLNSMIFFLRLVIRFVGTFRLLEVQIMILATAIYTQHNACYIGI